MKKSAIAALVAAPLLSLSSLAFAADPVPAEPMLLTATQMDTVTAAGPGDWARLFQINVSPVTVVQLNILSNGGINIAEIVSGNFGGIFQ